MKKHKRIGRLCTALVLIITVLCFCGMTGRTQGTESGNSTDASLSVTGEGTQESEEKEFSTDGTPPDLPDGEQFGERGDPPAGEPPDGMGGFPGGDFQPGEMPDGTPPDGEMPDGAPPEMNGENRTEGGEGESSSAEPEAPAWGENMPSGDMPQKGNFPDGEGFGNRDNFSGRDFSAAGATETQAETTAIDLETVLLLGASFLVLIGGLLFAKFYR